MHNLPRNHDNVWSDGEYKLLGKALKRGVKISEIAKFHGRTEFAIECAIKRYHDIINSVNVVSNDFIINGINYSKKFELAKKIIASVINGDTQYVRIGDKVWREVK